MKGFKFKTKFPDQYEYYKIDLDNPIEELRADLKAIPLALKQGYAIIEGAMFADEVKFKKENVTVWENRDNITRAELVDGFYTNHKRFATFAEALTY